MNISHLRIQNYKGLLDTATPLSDFVCAIGENNAGKSSLLQSLLLFINGPKLTKAEFYDPNKDILITATVSGVSEDALLKVAEDHRPKIAPYTKEGTITLARRYSPDGTSKLKVVTEVPKDLKFRRERIDEAFKEKKGNQIADVLTTFYPEVADAGTAAAATTQKAAKELIDKYVSQIPEAELTQTDIPLPTGIDNSVRAILPEPVYIPAVKDLADELKTKESASFGKLLNILLNVIESDLSEAADTFEKLRAKLNRIIQPDGTVLDDRMGKVKEIEETIQKNLQETFRNVTIELEIPPPEIKSVLSNASIVANDGVRSSVDNKGDGFKRAMTFSILRSYVQLSQDKEWQKDGDQAKATKDKFLFLFEEPELYLHPRAQNILFSALSMIAKRHQVVVTTHSPFFFSGDETTTFIKMVKRRPDDEKPIGVCLPIDLSDLTEKDRFQIISFETSNMAFFSNKIVLVEGDSEIIALPHIAKLFDESWDFKTTSTSLVKINGKGSFKRYKEFFGHFGIDVALITDLDILLDDFDKIGPNEKAKELRDSLIKDVDKIIDEANALPTPSAGLLKEELQRERSKKLYADSVACRKAGDIEGERKALDELFSFERTKPRLEVLKDSGNQPVLLKKRELLAELRKLGVFVLEKGALETYYPTGVVGQDKPTKAMSFCSMVASPDDVRALCDVIPCNGATAPELEVFMKDIFGSPAQVVQ